MKKLSSYKRILFKISGESLMGSLSFGHDYQVMKELCNEIKSVREMFPELQICLVVGGGNILRGASISSMGIDRTNADDMGMLATVINAIALQNCLQKVGVSTRVMSGVHMNSICEPYIRRKAIRHMEKGRLIILAAGIGNPFFTTDMAAVLRSVELNCEIILKGTKVRGVYSDDPVTNKDAVHYKNLTHKDVLEKELKVMDSSAIALAKEQSMPIIVFSIKDKGSLTDMFSDNTKAQFTLVSTS